MLNYLIINLIFINLIACSSTRMKKSDQGVIEIHTTIWNPSTGQSVAPLKIIFKIYFNGNKTIQEVPLLNIVNGETVSAVDHFSFVDPDKKIVRDYKNFSDTANIIGKYFNLDSLKFKGGWNLYDDQKFEYKSMVEMQDTTIDKVNYRRMRINKLGGDSLFFPIYIRCDKKGSVVKLFKQISDSIGCPIVRDETFLENKLVMIREIKYISDHLTGEELKVFNAWEKN